MDLSLDPFELPPLPPLPQSPILLASDTIVVDASELLTSDNPDVYQSLRSSDNPLNNNPFSTENLSAGTHRSISYNRKRGPGPSTNYLYSNKEPRIYQPTQSSAREAILKAR